MSNPLLSVENIETYYGPIMAIRGISFKVNQGSIVTILGSNGAGKQQFSKLYQEQLIQKRKSLFKWK